MHQSTNCQLDFHVQNLVRVFSGDSRETVITEKSQTEIELHANCLHEIMALNFQSCTLSSFNEHYTCQFDKIPN